MLRAVAAENERAATTPATPAAKTAKAMHHHPRVDDDAADNDASKASEDATTTTPAMTTRRRRLSHHHPNLLGLPCGGGDGNLTPPSATTKAAAVHYTVLTPRNAHHVVSQLKSSAKKRACQSPRIGVGAASPSKYHCASPRFAAEAAATCTPRKLDKRVNAPVKGKTPSKHFDRFIPNRSAMDMTTAHYKLTHAQDAQRAASQDGADTRKKYLDAQAMAYQEEIAKACGVSIGKRILAFKMAAPVREVEALKTIWKAPRAAANRRRIPNMPEKVLDAPGLADDYYLNLLDWSNGNILAVGLEKSVFVWNAETGEVGELSRATSTHRGLPAVVAEEDGHPDSISSVQFTHDGSHLAIGVGGGNTQIWDVESSTLVRTMRGHVSRVGVLAWDRHLLSSGARDGSIWHHDVRVAEHKVGEMLGHEAEVCGLKWRGDGNVIASGGNDNLVNLWDVRNWRSPKFSKADHTSAVKALAWCPWQLNLLATGGGSNDKKIHFWNSNTGAHLSTIDTGSQVTSLIWSRDYREILSTHGFPDNHITIWQYPSLLKITDLPGHDSRVLCSALSPDGQTVVTGAGDENLKFWKVFEKKNKGKTAGPGASGGRISDKDKDVDELVVSTKRMMIR